METSLIGIVILCSAFLVAGIALGVWITRMLTAGSSVDLNEHNRVQQDLAGLSMRVQEKSDRLRKTEEELAEQRRRTEQLGREVSAKETEILNLNTRLAEQKKDIEAINVRFNEEFRKIANQMLVDNSRTFRSETVENLKTVLTPLKENIDSFQKMITDRHEKQLSESASLKEQISQLTGLNQMMAEEARSLTMALKGESKTRGTWGELILEKILENSGLIRGEHFTVQKSMKDEENKRLQPDVVVHLPEGKHLIIDSKLSLVDYERYCDAADDKEREVHLKNHIASIKNHINALGSKEYQNVPGLNAPDFVLMFVPVEPALLTALEHDRELFVYAWKRNIALIAPTTLIPTLKIIHNIWRQESQNRNALEIAETGGKLYDKLAGFLSDLRDVGAGIEKTKSSYDEAVKKLSTGRGNAISLAEKMKGMGAKAARALPAGFVPDEV